MRNRIKSLALVAFALAATALWSTRDRRADATNDSYQLTRQTLSAASGTYTPAGGTFKILLRGCGGGGGGGGGKGSASNVGLGGGGAAGGYLEKWINCATICTGGAWTNGTAGTAGAITPTAGGAGGDGSIVINGVTYTLKGGGGGGSGNVQGAGVITVGGASSSGTTAGDVTVEGAPGGYGQANTIALGISGYGGSSPFGTGGIGKSATADGPAGTGNCSGGGGGASISTTTGHLGGVGTIGIILVDEFH